MDVHSQEVRSYNMSKIKSKHTKPEEMVCKYFFRKGYRYRKNVKNLPGCPDIVLRKYRTVIFVNGCFWHVHEDCPFFAWPSSNTDFWRDKLTKNKERDIKNHTKLKEMGWNVLVIWECELKKDSEKCLEEVIKRLDDNREWH